MIVFRSQQISAELKRKVGSAAMSISRRNGAHLGASLLTKPRTRPSPILKVGIEKITEWTSDLSGVQQRGWLYRIRLQLCIQSWPRSTRGVRVKVEQMVRVFHVAGPPCRLSLTHNVKVDQHRHRQLQDLVLTKCRR